MGSSILDQSCFECDTGVMKKIIPVHSYDYNKEGYVPLSCNNCGICSDVEEIIPNGILELKVRISNNFKVKILKIVCNCGRSFNYETYSSMLKQLKGKDMESLYVLAEDITDLVTEEGYTIDFSFVINTIYSKLNPRFDFV